MIDANAIHYPVNASGVGTDLLRHVQIVNCQQALWIEGSASASRQVALENCLFGNVEQAFAGSNWTAHAQHLTAGFVLGDNNDTLMPDPSAGVSLLATNCVFVNMAALDSSNDANTNISGLDGDFNGFDQNSLTFGSDTVTDSSPPFQGSTGSTLANYQAFYYLRDASPFSEAGTNYGIDPALLADFGQMTTTEPQLLTSDITSSQTLTPVVPRDTGPNPSLGYHSRLRHLERRMAGLNAMGGFGLKGAADRWGRCPKRSGFGRLQGQPGKRELTSEASHTEARAIEPVLCETRGPQSASVQERAADEIDGDLAVVVGHATEAGQVGSALAFANRVQAAHTNDQVAQSG
jgi:hypothetical protein